MKRFLILLVFVLLLGAAAVPAGAVPLGLAGRDDGTAFAYAVTSVGLNYDSGVGFGFGGGVYMGDNAGIFVEGGEGAYGVGFWLEPTDDLVLAVKYAHAGGWIYSWYGWNYMEVKGLLLGAYYKFPAGGFSGGAYADKNVALFGAGAVSATDGYYTATAFFLELQSLSYVNEDAAFMTALSFSGGALVSTLGLAVTF